MLHRGRDQVQSRTQSQTRWLRQVQIGLEPYIPEGWQCNLASARQDSGYVLSSNMQIEAVYAVETSIHKLRNAITDVLGTKRACQAKVSISIMVCEAGLAALKSLVCNEWR